jgi:enamine deaminase RidA (YjgF/YER057c/UK114 family)
VISPLHCSARDYGSCFSRAVEIGAPDMRRLLISGTASISRDGMTDHVGDFAAQVNETFEVVEAILNSRNMRWKDVSRANAYLRHAKDAAAFDQFLSNNGYHLPLVTTRADVCRDDLLFELEVDAVVSTARPLRSDWDI